MFLLWVDRFGLDCELSTIAGLFEIIFLLSGLLIGFTNNGFLFKLSLKSFPSAEGITGDFSSLFLLWFSF